MELMEKMDAILRVATEETKEKGQLQVALKTCLLVVPKTNFFGR